MIQIYREKNKEDVQSYYDDWYLYGIMDGNGGFTFSLLKMREQESDGGDGDTPGITVPFIGFDIRALAEATDGNTKILEDSITETISGEKFYYDENLQKPCKIRKFF